jgi:hypothetical protein
MFKNINEDGKDHLKSVRRNISRKLVRTNLDFGMGLKNS